MYISKYLGDQIIFSRSIGHRDDLGSGSRPGHVVKSARGWGSGFGASEIWGKEGSVLTRGFALLQSRPSRSVCIQFLERVVARVSRIVASSRSTCGKFLQIVLASRGRLRVASAVGRGDDLLADRSLRRPPVTDAICISPEVVTYGSDLSSGYSNGGIGVDVDVFVTLGVTRRGDYRSDFCSAISLSWGHCRRTL